MLACDTQSTDCSHSTHVICEICVICGGLDRQGAASAAPAVASISDRRSSGSGGDAAATGAGALEHEQDACGTARGARAMPTPISPRGPHFLTSSIGRFS